MKKTNNGLTKLNYFGAFDYVIWGILAVICYFSFQQVDILHTAGSSLSYLNGHIWDFYDENLKYLSADAYMPSTYILFAIWNIPIRLIRLVTVPSMTVPTVALMWYKLLPVLIYMVCGVLIYKICIELGLDNKNAKIGAYIFLSCPMGFFSQFIFGQYDIFTVVFMLLGFYYYLKDDKLKFILFFSIAVTFKYFALLFFVPLLLLKEKNILKIIVDFVLALVPFLLEVVFYIHSSAFREGVFGFGATNYIFATNVDTGFCKISIVVVLWIVTCALAYVDANSKKQEISIFYLNVVAFLCFGLSMWHPQWLLLIVPFMSLGIVINKRSDLLLILEFILMCVACVFIVNQWPDHVDQQLFNNGVLHNLAHEQLGSKLNMRTLYIIQDRDLLMTLFSGCLCALTVLKLPRYCITREKIKSVRLQDQIWMIRLRFVGGVLFFVIPAFICLFSSMKAPYMYYSSMNNITGYIGNESKKISIEQDIQSQYDYVSMFDIRTGTYEVPSNGTIKLSVIVDGKIVRRASYDMAKVKRENIEEFDIKDVYVGKGKLYTVKIVLNPDEGSIAIPLYYSNTGTPCSVVNGKQEDYNVCIRAFGVN